MASNNVSNNSSLFVPPDYLQESFPAKVFKLTFQITIALLGVIGNVLICSVIANRPNMRTSMYCYIFSLAVADLGVLLVNFPLAVVRSEDPYGWPFGETFCLYIYPATDIFFGASIWSITVIAIERYRHIVSKPQIRQNHKPKHQAARFITAVWVTSFIVVALPVYLITRYNRKYGCYIIWESEGLKLAYITGLVFFWYILPLGTISYTYIAISHRLRVSNAFLRSMHGEQNGVETEECRRVRNNKKAQSILTPLVVLFAISMAPLNIFRLIMSFYRPFIVWRYYWTVFNVCIVGVIVNSASNPVIYTMVSQEFRNGIKRLIKPCHSRSPCHTSDRRHRGHKFDGGRISLDTNTSCIGFDAVQDTAL